MRASLHLLSACSVGLAAALSAQIPQPVQIRAPGTDAEVRVWSERGVAKSAVSRDHGLSWQALAQPDFLLHLRYATFDPALSAPVVPPVVQAHAGDRLFIAQFASPIIGEYRDALRALGAEVHSYLPSQAYVVRMDRQLVAQVAALPFVRFVGELHPAFRLEPEILDDLVAGRSLGTRQYNLLTVHQHADAADLERVIAGLGGTVDQAAEGSGMVVATLAEAHLVQLMHEDTVLWIDRTMPIEFDMNNARIQAGADYVETFAGLDGKGMRAHIFEGIQQNHPEFAARSPYRTAPIIVRTGGSTQHGTNTAGEVFAQGLDARAKGGMPFAQGLFTISGGNRYTLYRDLVDPNLSHRAMSSTASWGSTQTTAYTSISVTMDTSIFDWDLFVTQSQSNLASRLSRPEAWAKNVCSVGGFRHFNNSNPGDDCWCNTGSTGPASDGRIGVTLTAYYDNIFTTNTGSSYTGTFGGTSGATPMCNGFGGLAMQMFTEGLLGYPGVTWQNRFDAKPHFTTTKALLAATAAQIPFNRANRYQQGWGFPALEKMYNNRDEMLVLDEEDVLVQGQSRTYFVFVKPGTPDLRVAMQYADPAGVANSTVHRVNSLDLRVDAPGGLTYWGNEGLLTGEWSAPGGVANDRDTEECVFIQSPVPGTYVVTVSAPAVRQDSHVETAAVDADFALVVSGIGGGRDKSDMLLDLISNQSGELKVSLTNLPVGFAGGLTLFSLATSRHLGLGNVYGLELDALAASVLGFPASAGSVFHFTPTGTPGLYPNATFDFPPALVQAIQGVTLDAVAFVYDQSGATIAASNVDRITVQ